MAARKRTIENDLVELGQMMLAKAEASVHGLLALPPEHASQWKRLWRVDPHHLPTAIRRATDYATGGFHGNERKRARAIVRRHLCDHFGYQPEPRVRRRTKTREGEAWLRRQLDGLGKGGDHGPTR